MTTIHMGVIDIPYTTPIKGFKKNSPHAAHHGAYGALTTGDVGEILENRYGIMQAYYNSKQIEIAKSIENSCAGHIENLILGAPKADNFFAQAAGDMEAGYKRFLALQEVEKLGIPGVPTKAALDGISHRFKNPRWKIVKGKKVKRPRRPSFIDTGLYQASAKVWID